MINPNSEKGGQKKEARGGREWGEKERKKERKSKRKERKRKKKKDG